MSNVERDRQMLKRLASSEFSERRGRLEVRGTQEFRERVFSDVSESAPSLSRANRSEREERR